MTRSRIVVAEDDEFIRDLLEMTLLELDVDVVTAPDGPHALEACRGTVPALVLLDVSMPGQSGLEVCRELRADPRLDDVPVVMLTALARDDDMAAGYDAGATDYVVKPFSPEELLSRVRTLLPPQTG